MLNNSCFLKKFHIIVALLILPQLNVRAVAQSIPAPEKPNWYKSDLHTHHTFNDPLQKIVQRYRDTGYNFVVLSSKDMQKVVNYEKFSTPEMRIINGVELAFITRKEKLGHVLGFRIKTPYRFTTNWTLKEGYAKLREKNEKVIMGVCHPHDQRWTLEDIMEAWKEGLPLFELNSIDMKHGEFETTLWDAALSKGARMYATLVNDVHHYNDIDAYGYILIRAKTLGMKHISDALRAGDFYAVESGCAAKVEKHELLETEAGKTIEVSAPGAAEIRVIGTGGKVLKSFKTETISYPIETREKYVRLEILDENGLYTFMQPFFIED